MAAAAFPFVGQWWLLLPASIWRPHMLDTCLADYRANMQHRPNASRTRSGGARLLRRRCCCTSCWLCTHSSDDPCCSNVRATSLDFVSELRHSREDSRSLNRSAAAAGRGGSAGSSADTGDAARDRLARRSEHAPYSRSGLQLLMPSAYLCGDLFSGSCCCCSTSSWWSATRSASTRRGCGLAT